MSFTYKVRRDLCKVEYNIITDRVFLDQVEFYIKELLEIYSHKSQRVYTNNLLCKGLKSLLLKDFSFNIFLWKPLSIFSLSGYLICLDILPNVKVLRFEHVI